MQSTYTILPEGAYTKGPIQIIWDDLPEVSKDKIIQYGLKRYLNDVQAGEKDSAIATGKVETRLANLLAGIIRANAQDPLEKVMREILSEALLKKGKVKNRTEAISTARSKTLAELTQIKGLEDLAKKRIRELEKLKSSLGELEDLGDGDATTP